MTLELNEEDLKLFHKKGIVSKYKRYDAWLVEFKRKLPSFQEGCLTFTFSVNREGLIRYSDILHKNNRYIIDVLPKIQNHSLSLIHNLYVK